jgi:hypothetical protein
MTGKNVGFPQDPGGWHYQGSADTPSATYTFAAVCTRP